MEVEHLQVLLDPASRRTAAGAQELVPLLEQMLDEFETATPESEALVKGLLQVFLAKLVRRWREAQVSDAAWRYIDRALDYADAHPQPWPTVDELAQAAGIGKSRLHQLFLRRFAQAPARYLMQRRLDRARSMLSAGRESVTDIALKLGFSSSQHFATAFKQHSGMTPTQFRQTVYL